MKNLLNTLSTIATGVSIAWMILIAILVTVGDRYDKFNISRRS